MNKLFSIIKSIFLSKTIVVYFINSELIHRENIRFYKKFTSYHPKYKIIKLKKYGACFIDLKKYDSFEIYLENINGKNSAAYYRRKSVKNNFIFAEIDRNDFIEDIYEINNSSQIRQNRKMDSSYTKKITQYSDSQLFRYYGIIKNKKLVAYTEIGYHGDFISFNQIIGHKDYQNFGIIYHLIIEVIKDTIEKYVSVRWVYYDMYYGASKGLQDFKRKFLFKPYNVNWKIK
tara:strand:+ start:1333 stop:2025 length:693 start_codon:yes stop_codon:yes gene_type:complete